MTKFGWTMLGLILICLAIEAATFPINNGYRAKSRLYQLVEVTGSTVKPLDKPPKELIVDDRNAVLPSETPGSPERLNNSYLNEHRIIPLELKQVETYVVVTRFSLGLLMVILGLMFIVGARKRAPT